MKWYVSRPSILPLALSSSVLALSSMAAPAHAGQVAPGQSIQAAIDSASPGELIQLQAGSYSGNLVLRSNVKLVGAGSSLTVLSGNIQVPASAGQVELSGISAGALTASAPNLKVVDGVFSGTVQFKDNATATFTDSRFNSYLTHDGQAQVSHLRTQAQEVAFTRESAKATFTNSEFGSYYELSGTSQTSFVDSQLKGAYLSGNAQASLKGVISSGSVTTQDTSRVFVQESTLSRVAWSEDGYISLEDSRASALYFVISAGVDASLLEVGPGLLTAASASATTGPFGALLSNVEVGSVAFEVYGELHAVGGGLNGYSYVRDGGTARLEDFDYAQYSIVEGSGQLELLDSVLSADLILRGTSQTKLEGALSTGGKVVLEGSASASLGADSDIKQVEMRGNGALSGQDATLRKLVLVVEANKGAEVEGLAPGLLNGAVVTPVPAGGPALSAENLELISTQLWIQGTASVNNSRIDDYLVVEDNGEASLRRTTFSSFGLFRDDALVTCVDCVSGAFLFVENNSLLTWERGEVRNFVELRQDSLSSFRNLNIAATFQTVGQAQAQLRGATSTSSSVRVGGKSLVSLAGASDLYAVTAYEEGQVAINDSHVRTLTFEVGTGYDVKIEGLRSGLVSGSYGPQLKGPTVSLSATQLDGASVLTRGHAEVLNSELRGYTFTYENASSSFTNSVLSGVTYLLSGSQNTFVGGEIRNLFNVQGSTNLFTGTTFTSAASAYLGGASQNTFTRCIFEKGVTLSDSSSNNFGQTGVNIGENDFSRVSGYFKLANNTANTVYAQNNLWGTDDTSLLASLIVDQADNSAYGPVIYDPIKRRNAPPAISAGDSRFISSFDQESTVLVGQASDPDGDGMSYRWLEGELVLLDDTPVLADGTAPLNLGQLAYLGAGDHLLTLEVTDAFGYIVTSTTVLSIGNSSPLTTAVGGGVFSEGEAIVLSGELSDYDGDLVSYRWWLGDTLLFSGEVQTLIEGEVVAVPERVLTQGLPAGMHTLVLEVEDGLNAPVTSSIDVQVVDLTPPVMSPVANPALLWPPTGDMRTVVIDTYAMDSSGGAVTLSARVSSNEPRWQSYFGKPDWSTPVIDQTTGRLTVQLRAEVNLNGNVREYTIWLTATDKAGNKTNARLPVRVAWRRGAGCWF